MTEPLINKLSFDGFHVTVWNHETRGIEEFSFPTTESVEARGFKGEFPTAAEFADGLFDVYGDCVGKIVDNKGYVLYDNMKEMFSVESSCADR